MTTQVIYHLIVYSILLLWAWGAGKFVTDPRPRRERIKEPYPNTLAHGFWQLHQAFKPLQNALFSTVAPIVDYLSRKLG